MVWARWPAKEWPAQRGPRLPSHGPVSPLGKWPSEKATCRLPMGLWERWVSLAHIAVPAHANGRSVIASTHTQLFFLLSFSSTQMDPPATNDCNGSASDERLLLLLLVASLTLSGFIKLELQMNNGGTWKLETNPESECLFSRRKYSGVTVRGRRRHDLCYFHI